MSLYDRRNYADGYEVSDASLDQGRISKTIKETYALLTASMVAATAGAFVAMNFGVSLALNPIVYLILLMGLIFGMQAAVNRGANTIALILLFAFTFISGLTLTPILARTFAMPGGAAIVAQSFTLTTVAFGGLSVFAMNTKRDFTVWGKMLFITLIVLLVAMLMNLFFQSPIFQVALSCVAAVLFSAYILYDTQNIIRGNYETPIEGAVALYLDFVNLFVSLLRILGFINSND